VAGDPTMNELSLFGSKKWASSRLGLSRDRFQRKLDALENNGFPKVDRITNLYVKADIDAWINRRRQVSDQILHISAAETKQEVNLDAI